MIAQQYRQTVGYEYCADISRTPAESGITLTGGRAIILSESKKMDNYQHILIAVDFSEHGNHVIRKAKHLAGIFHAKLSIIHVLDNIPMPDTGYGTVIPLNERSTYELLETEKSKLKQIGDQLEVDAGCRWMVWGVPGKEIVRIAEQEHMDLIVIGSHGRHGLALLLGSTASDVLHHAKCDVMAIRLQDEVTEDEPLMEKAALGSSA